MLTITPVLSKREIQTTEISIYLAGAFARRGIVVARALRCGCTQGSHMYAFTHARISVETRSAGCGRRRCLWSCIGCLAESCRTMRRREVSRFRAVAVCIGWVYRYHANTVEEDLHLVIEVTIQHQTTLMLF